MTREIKFRAWVKPIGKMTDSFTLLEISQGINETFLNADVMQFTGLKDKNGKEIFEGDIVRIPRYETRECILLIKEISHLGLFLVYIHPYTTGVFWGSLSRLDEVEVIGNKFENPELLK